MSGNLPSFSNSVDITHALRSVGCFFIYALDRKIRLFNMSEIIILVLLFPLPGIHKYGTHSHKSTPSEGTAAISFFIFFHGNTSFPRALSAQFFHFSLQSFPDAFTVSDFNHAPA